MWFTIKEQQVMLHILAKPNARKTALLQVTTENLQIALHAKPQDGAANKELIAYLAKTFKIAKSQVILEKGDASRYKRVSVPLVAFNAVKDTLLKTSGP